MQCLEPHFVDGYPQITLAAEIADTSVRTLQRRLAEQGAELFRRCGPRPV